MKSFLQNLLGISDLRESNEQIQKQFEVLTSRSSAEDIANTYATKFAEEREQLHEWFSSLQDTQKMELAEIGQKLNQLLPQQLDIKHLEILKEIEFIAGKKLNLIDTEQLSRKIEGATLISKSDAKEGLLSQALAGTTSAGIAKYISNGLYSTTASPEQLMKYANGTYASIVKNGSKISNHNGFSKVSFTAMAPMLAFQAATMITSQVHMQQINKKLGAINEKVGYLFDFHKNERTAKLKYIHQKINEFSERNFFTTEDFVLMDQFKYDLHVIKEESAQFFVKHLVDKFQKLGIDIEAGYDLAVVSKDKKSRWTKFKGTVNSVNQQMGKYFEKSKSKVEETIKDFENSEIFFFAEISVTAEKLYENLLLTELIANLKVKELDRNRIGKIDELRISMEHNLQSEKTSEMIADFYRKFDVGFKSFVAQKRQSAFEKNQSGIIAVIEKFDQDLSILKGLLDLESDATSAKNFTKEFYDEYEIIIENTGEEELVYMKKVIG